MKANTEPLEANTFYHIYNRGINGEDLFKEDRNYAFFLEKYLKYFFPVAHTYAYCLLKNHFHILICTRSDEELQLAFPTKDYTADKIISLQFGHLFNSYAQAINKRFSRTGGLFETPFRRIAVKDEAYLTKLIYYIHLNPQKHGFTDDFAAYPHSSYPVYISDEETHLERIAGIEWFGGKNEFIMEHRNAADKNLFHGDEISYLINE